MTFEIEKRSLLKNKKEFEKLKEYLDKNASFLTQRKIKSYLFRQPAYLRIRLEEGVDKVMITQKIGSYQDKARKEINKEISYNQVPRFLKKISEEGYTQCSEILTSRISYELDGLKIELNEISHLGLIVEVETLTEKESEVRGLHEKVNEILKKLKLKGLSAVEYQKMMNEMYAKTLKDIASYSFSL